MAHNQRMFGMMPFLYSQSAIQTHARLYTTQSFARQSNLQHERRRFSSCRCFKEAKNTSATAKQGLTHVDESGAAHMVDVGRKSSTRRVAIAVSQIVFSNPDPFTMIKENTNRKGDVIGVARIAGLMAAKKTSDLIPLCHPLAISKVELDLKLFASSSSADHDGVVIQALVECNGQTGVEMEALTAANVAALTIYDMCKAVDKSMIIRDTKVVWKSGGKSGVFCDRYWAETIENSFFDQRGLTKP